MSSKTHTELYAELQLAPDVEIDFMLARAIGYQQGQILRTKFPNRSVEVFHGGSWRTFSHKDHSVAWPLAVKNGLLPVQATSWDGLESEVPQTSGPITRYKVSKAGLVSNNGAVTFYNSPRQVIILADTPERALAVALILKNRIW
jgi:hypothetical protein